MNLQQLRKLTHQLHPHETPVVVRLKVDSLRGEIVAGYEPPLSIVGHEYEYHEESGTWTLWLEVEES